MFVIVFKMNLFDRYFCSVQCTFCNIRRLLFPTNSVFCFLIYLYAKLLHVQWTVTAWSNSLWLPFFRRMIMDFTALCQRHCQFNSKPYPMHGGPSEALSPLQAHLSGFICKYQGKEVSNYIPALKFIFYFKNLCSPYVYICCRTLGFVPKLCPKLWPQAHWQLQTISLHRRVCSSRSDRREHCYLTLRRRRLAFLGNFSLCSEKLGLDCLHPRWLHLPLKLALARQHQGPQHPCSPLCGIFWFVTDCATWISRKPWSS